MNHTFTIARHHYEQALKGGIATIQYQAGSDIRSWDMAVTLEDLPEMKEIFEKTRVCGGGKYLTHTFRTHAEIEGLVKPNE